MARRSRGDDRDEADPEDEAEREDQRADERSPGADRRPVDVHDPHAEDRLPERAPGHREAHPPVETGERDAERRPGRAAVLGRVEVVLEEEVQEVGRHEHSHPEQRGDDADVDDVGHESGEGPGRLVRDDGLVLHRRRAVAAKRVTSHVTGQCVEAGELTPAEIEQRSGRGRRAVGHDVADLHTCHQPGDVGPAQQRINVGPLEEPVDVDPIQQGVDIDPVEQGVHVDMRQEPVDIDPIEQAVHVDPIEEPIGIHPVQRLVEVDPFDDCVDVDRVDNRMDERADDPVHPPPSGIHHPERTQSRSSPDTLSTKVLTPGHFVTYALGPRASVPPAHAGQPARRKDEPHER